MKLCPGGSRTRIMPPTATGTRSARRLPPVPPLEAAFDGWRVGTRD